MAKKTTVNKIDRALETPESSQKENQSPEEKREAYVRYRVSAPGGVHLRVGPARMRPRSCGRTGPLALPFG